MKKSIQSLEESQTKQRNEFASYIKPSPTLLKRNKKTTSIEEDGSDSEGDDHVLSFGSPNIIGITDGGGGGGYSNSNGIYGAESKEEIIPSSVPRINLRGASFSKALMGESLLAPSLLSPDLTDTPLSGRGKESLYTTRPPSARIKGLYIYSAIIIF